MNGKLTTSQQQLLREAKKAREAAYAPYSKFKVGAAVRTRAGNVYTGCNVENASYGLSMCAERIAIFKAVTAGDTDITDIALLTDTPTPSSLCGACRQVLFQFGKSSRVVAGNLEGSVVVSSVSELLPHPFRFDPPPA